MVRYLAKEFHVLLNRDLLGLCLCFRNGNGDGMRAVELTVVALRVEIPLTFLFFLLFPLSFECQVLARHIHLDRVLMTSSFGRCALLIKLQA